MRPVSRVSGDSDGPYDPRALRDACRLAVEVARAGERADPSIVAPAALRPLLSFARLPPTALAVVQRTLEEDADFRTRVAAEAGAVDATVLSPTAWLWLVRPDGWSGDPAVVAARRGSAPPDGSRDEAVRQRERLERARGEASEARARANAAELDRRRMVDDLGRCRADLDAARSAGEELRRTSEQAREERNRTVRHLKSVEADLAESRRLLKAARAATLAAESELRELRLTSPPPVDTRDLARARDDERGADAARAVAARTAVEEASAAAEILARTMERTVALLRRATPGPDAAGSPGTGNPSRTVAAGSTGSLAAHRSPRRLEHRAGMAGDGSPPGGSLRDRGQAELPSLPPGVLRDSDGGRRHVVTSGEALIVIDGYNLARTAWTGLTPEEERRRTVSMVEELAARSGAVVTVVFDGDDDASAPAASRWVRVLFSGTGETADDAIADLVADLAPSRPVVVVSTDREVADAAGSRRAQPMDSASFLRAIGR